MKEIIVKEYRNEQGLITRREIGQELVRCKECKWRGEQTESGIPYYWCRLVGVGYEVPIEHYCSYGERKDECKECWYWSEVYKRCENKCGCQFKPYGERKESE